MHSVAVGVPAKVIRRNVTSEPIENMDQIDYGPNDFWHPARAARRLSTSVCLHWLSTSQVSPPLVLTPTPGLCDATRSP
eukprot:357938-Chlamydomonas_euryale.AAC.1